MAEFNTEQDLCTSPCNRLHPSTTPITSPFQHTDNDYSGTKITISIDKIEMPKKTIDFGEQEEKRFPFHASLTPLQDDEEQMEDTIKPKAHAKLTSGIYKRGKTQFKCSVCQANYTTLGHLKDHLRSHTDER